MRSSAIRYLVRAGQHTRNVVAHQLQLLELGVADPALLHSQGQEGSDFSGRASCNEEIPSETTVSLLAEPFSYVGYDGNSGALQLVAKGPVIAKVAALDDGRN